MATPPSATNEGSGLRFVSMGLAAENKPMRTKELLVIPIEALPFSDGELKSNPQVTEAKGKDGMDLAWQSKTVTDNAVKAMWYPGNSGNQSSPPDIRRGERVRLYRYMDTDQYWWECTGLDGDKRRLETVVYTFSGTADEKADPQTPDNSYNLTVSTHEGKITLTTSKANQEHCRYAIQINAKDGRIVISDDVGNDVTLDSAATNITATNASGTHVELNKQKILMRCDDSITMQAAEDIRMETKRLTIEASESVKISTKSYELDCTTYKTTAATNAGVTSPIITLTGLTTIAGNLSVTAGGGGSGMGTWAGSVNFLSPVQMSAPLMASGITSSAPINAPNID